MDIPLTQLPPGDPRLVDAIVGQLKSKGIFDRFRKECLADVDTKPAFLNLRQRVDGQVKKFLDTKTWKNDLNKNHLRDGVRKNIQESGILDTGIDAIINQAVNPKIKTLILPFVEDTVYAFLQIDKPKREIQEYDIQQSIHNEQKPSYLYQNPMPQPYPMYQEIPPLYYPQEFKEEPLQQLMKTELDINEKDDSIVSSESEISVGGKSLEETKPQLLPSTDLLPMETDVISSGDDDILARASSETVSSISSEPKIGEDIKMDEDNAVDSFDTARGDSEGVTNAVEKLTLKEGSGEGAIESMEIEKDREINKTCGPLFDTGSLDSISSNSSGLSFSPISANKSSVPDLNSLNATKHCENSAKSFEELRSTQSTPLVDEKSPQHESISSSENSKSWAPYTIPKDLPSTERITIASFTPFSSGSIKESARVVEGASPVSADDSQGSIAGSSVEKGSFVQTGDESQESKTAKSEKSEGEITSSSSSSSPKHSKDTTSSSRSSYDKEAHKSSKSESYSSRRNSKSSHRDRERNRDKSHKSKNDKERRHSKEKHDDHSSYRDKDKPNRRDKDDDKDRDRCSKGHYSASNSGGNSGKVSSTDNGSKEKRERTTDKSSEHKSHSSSHSRSDKSHSKKHESKSSSSRESSHKSHKSKSSDKHCERNDKKSKDDKNKKESDSMKQSDKKDSDLLKLNDKKKSELSKSIDKKSELPSQMELQNTKAEYDSNSNSSLQLCTKNISNSSSNTNSKCQTDSKSERDSHTDSVSSKSELHSNLTSEVENKPNTKKPNETKPKGIKDLKRRSLKEDDIFELHLSNTKKDAVLPKPTNSLTKTIVKKPNIVDSKKDNLPVPTSISDDKKSTNPTNKDSSKLTSPISNVKKQIAKGSKLNLDKENKNTLLNKYKSAGIIDSSTSSSEDEIELNANKVRKMKRTKRNLNNIDNDDNNNGKVPNGFKVYKSSNVMTKSPSSCESKVKRKLSRKKLIDSSSESSTEMSDKEVVIQEDDVIVFKKVTIPLMDVINESKLAKKRKINGSLPISPTKKRVVTKTTKKSPTKKKINNKIDKFNLFAESSEEFSEFEGFGGKNSTNLNKKFEMSGSDSSDMELSLLKFCRPKINYDFEGFNSASVENSNSADQKLRDYLAQFSADSTIHLNDFLDSDSNEDYGSEMTVFCSNKGSSKSVIEEIASRTSSNLNSEPNLGMGKSEDVADKRLVTQIHQKRIKRSLSESSCASGSSFSPQSKKNRRSISLTNEKTRIDEYISEEKVITSSYSLLTPEEDRTSSKEYEVDLSQRETSYSPLSPASDSSAEELRAKHLTKESAEVNCGKAVKFQAS